MSEGEDLFSEKTYS